MDDQALSSRETERLRQAPFTYAGVGSSGSDTVPSGYAHLRRHLVVGAGQERLEQAARVLLGWDMHRRAGLGVRASDEQVVAGAVAVLRWGVGRFGVDAPVRVVHLVEEPHRRGFAYGTLPGHPESGEEAFVLELHPDGVVTFTITAFSRPGSALARVGGPIGRATQAWITRRYLRAV